MIIKSLGVRTIIIGASLIAGIASGVIGFNSATASNTKPIPVYEINENVETSGSDLQAISPETEPDLISAVGEDGTEGYVRSTDLHGVKPKTPKEALEQQNKMKAQGGRKIQFYDVDGKTVIGTFKIDPPGGIVKITK